VREKLTVCAAAATDGLILNADDQNVLMINADLGGSAASTSWFGIAPQLLAAQEHGLGYAPTYSERLARPVVTSEIRTLESLTANGQVADLDFSVQLPNRGLHFALDAVAALASARRLLGESFDLGLAVQTLNDLPPVFARGEIAVVEGQEVEFILVQNPMSFQLNLDYLNTAPERIMVAIGRDVHDPSWLWTVDLEKLTHADVVTGYNAFEMAQRMAYDEIPMSLVTDDLDQAVRAFLELPAPTRGRKTVIFSADAMRRIRRMLGLTDPESVQR
jgi:UDP-N-acetylmuramyl tripeptide synthase